MEFYWILYYCIFICIHLCISQQGQPLITFYESQLPITEGQKLTLSCSHSYNRRNVRYRWILSSQPRRGFYDHGSQITFINIDRRDRILVTCQVFSVTGTLGESRHALVEAQYMDQPVLFADSWDIRNSDTVNMRCTVNSRPDFEYIEILKDGKRVHLGSRYEISKVDKSHVGKYSCRAKSAYFSMTSQEHELSVEGISTKAIHVMAYFGGVFFPLLIVIFVVMATCRYISRRRSKTKLNMSPDLSPTDPANFENVSKDTDIYYVGRFNRSNSAVPPSYDEAVNEIQPPSYDEVTQSNVSAKTGVNE